MDVESASFHLTAVEANVSSMREKVMKFSIDKPATQSLADKKNILTRNTLLSYTKTIADLQVGIDSKTEIIRDYELEIEENNVDLSSELTYHPCDDVLSERLSEMRRKLPNLKNDVNNLKSRINAVRQSAKTEINELKNKVELEQDAQNKITQEYNKTITLSEIMAKDLERSQWTFNNEFEKFTANNDAFIAWWTEYMSHVIEQRNQKK